MVMASDTYSLLRLSLCSVKKLPTHLKQELENFNGRYPFLIKSLISAIKNNWQQINWQIKKYHIEFLTDHFLYNNDWQSLHSLLLEHQDSVIRVETALDLLYIATEEYPVWCVRYFTKELTKRYQELLMKNKNNIDEIVHVFSKSIYDQDETYSLDSSFGYRNTTVQYQVYVGISNAAYRGFDISIIVSQLIQWLSHKDKWFKDRALETLKTYAENKLEHTQQILTILNNPKLNKKDIKPILLICNKIINKQ
jgi:hypothetical protein